MLTAGRYGPSDQLTPPAALPLVTWTSIPWPAVMLQVPVATPDVFPLVTTQFVAKLTVVGVPLKVVILTVNVALVPAVGFAAEQ